MSTTNNKSSVVNLFSTASRTLTQHSSLVNKQVPLHPCELQLMFYEPIKQQRYIIAGPPRNCQGLLGVERQQYRSAIGFKGDDAITEDYSVKS